MVYTLTGPFTDGSAPGISASFLNNVENYLQYAVSDSSLSSTAGILTVLGLKDNPAPVQVTGSVSGTCTLWQPLQGTVKICFVIANNYQSGGAQTLTLPVPFTSLSHWWTTELQGGKAEGLSSGTAITFSIQITQALSGGTKNPQTYINQYSTGMARSAFDTLRMTCTTGTSGTIFIIGS